MRWTAKLTSALFAERLARRRGPVKGLLLDQSFVAGIGNIYGDEICYQARVSPFARVEELSPARTGRLYRSMRTVLRTAIERDSGARGFPDGWLIPQPGKDAPCPGCRGSVVAAPLPGSLHLLVPGMPEGIERPAGRGPAPRAVGVGCWSVIALRMLRRPASRCR